MPRIMTIWLPRWPVQRRLIERPELRKLPVFVCRREQRGIMRVVSWAWAEPPRREPHRRRAAIQPGMPLAEAMAVLALAHGSRACHIAAVEPDDPVADRLLLERVGRWCRRFAPAVGIEALPAGMPGAWQPQCLHLDITGTAGFFGGEASLARTAAWTLAARGLHARVAIADTPAAAWAAAHHTHLVATAEPASTATGSIRRRAWGGGPAGRRWAVVPPGVQRLARGEAAVLAGLPLVALRLEAAASGMLQEVGIDTIGGALRLPAKSLAGRFPSSLAIRLAEFTGDRAEPIEPARGDSLPQARHDFELPLSLAAVDESFVAGLLEPLVGRCLEPLVARGEGLTAVQVRLDPAAAIHAAAAAPPTVIDVGLFRPSLSVRHVVELVRLRLGRTRLPREIESLSVEVVAAGPAACRQRGLFEAEAVGGSTESRAAEVAGLLDRLAGRLGRTAVFQPQAVADPQPEHAWIAAPPGPPTAAPSRAPAPRSGLPATAGRRPVWMPARPLPLEPLQAGLLAVVPDGPPARFRLGGTVHRIVAAHGPERIETAWWRGPTVRRDYYVVETETGSRFWLFRRLGGPAARGARSTNWYLHGVFA
jgi:protein ImuB